MGGEGGDTDDIARVRFRDLGPLVVEVGSSTRALSARPAAALAALLVHANRRVTVDALSAAIWHDGRSRSASTLESHLWRLRHVLEPDRPPGEAWSLLVTEPGGYRLVVAADQVDSLRFVELVEDAGVLLAGGEPAAALHRLEQARDLWRGRPFAPVADQLWAAPVVARLQEMRYQLDERHIESLLALGRPEQALVELESALGEHPLRERLWVQRMLASYRAGRVDDALAAFGAARSRLLSELGTEPTDELRDMQRRILSADPTLRGGAVRTEVETARPGPGTGTGTLPRWSSRLVGRGDELRRLTGLVRPSSLVTLCGPAGVGKTRLAGETAHRVADSFPDGVWFADLTGTHDIDQIVDAVSTALGLAAAPAGSPGDALQAFLGDRRSLLLLDDCEHVLGAVTTLVERLRVACPELGLLVTSRERLALDAESVVEVPPLGIPDGERADSAALDLFLDRCESETGPTDPDDLDDARRVCRAVEGVPLALELAAARARTFTLAEIAEQAETDPSLLSRLGQRRRGEGATVYAAVDRSYRLLDDDERRLHRSLSVLPGPFTVSAAAALAQVDGATAADLLADLTHRSLVVARGPSSPRRPSSFAQLTIVRAHAARCLSEGGETEAITDRQDAWIARTAGGPRPRLGTPADLARSRALDDDRTALRSTLQRTVVERPSHRGPEIVAELGALFWFQHDATAEGARWIELAHGLGERDPGVDPVTRLQLTIGLATARAFAGRTDQAGPLSERALRDLAPGDLDPAQELLVGDDLVVLSTCLGLVGETARARDVLDVADGIAARTADPLLALLCRIRARMAELGRRPPGEVLREVDAAYRDALAVDNWFGAWISSAVAHMAALAARDAETALTWSDACLAVVDRTGRRQAPLQLELRANTLVLLGRHEEALRIYAAARSQNDRAGLPWPTAPDTEALLARARDAVPREAAERAGRDVAYLSVRDLLAATALQDRPAGPASVPTPDGRDQSQA